MNEIKKEAEEAGDMHSKGCCVNTKYGCDSITKNCECCDNMKFIGGLIDKTSLTQKKKDAEIIGSLKGVADTDVRNGEWLIEQEEATKAILNQDDE